MIVRIIPPRSSDVDVADQILADRHLLGGVEFEALQRTLRRHRRRSRDLFLLRVPTTMGSIPRQIIKHSARALE
jgi:hypothetical protein